MSRKLVGFIVAFCLMLLPAAAMAARPCESPVGASVTVMGQVELSFKADQAVLYIGVVSQEPTAKEAAKVNVEISDAVLTAVNKIKSSVDKLETAGYSLSAVKQYDRTTSINVLKGYRAVHTLKFTSANLKAMGEVIDAAVSAGAKDINGPNWGLYDPAAARNKALKAAVKDARIQAEALAVTAGLKLGALLRANSAPHAGSGPAPMRAAALEANSGGTKLEPGSVVVGANVLCTYSLTTR